MLIHNKYFTSYVGTLLGIKLLSKHTHKKNPQKTPSQKSRSLQEKIIFNSDIWFLIKNSQARKHITFIKLNQGNFPFLSMMQEIQIFLANCLKISIHLISSHFTEAGKNLFYSQLKQGKAFPVLINKASMFPLMKTQMLWRCVSLNINEFKFVELVKFVPLSYKGGINPSILKYNL